MNTEAAGQSEKAGQTGEKRQGGDEPRKGGTTKREKWDASWERVALGVTAAAGGGLVMATWIGVGPAALAGAAGYMAYRALNEKRRTADAGSKG